MKKILGITASPRKLGNSEIMIKEISRRIDDPHELNLLRLSDFNIQSCLGCYRCLFKEERCVLEDDLYAALEPILEADALILAVPTYFLGPNAHLKLFLDRGLAFYAHIKRLWGKPSVGVGIAGLEGKEGSTLLGIENFLKMILSDIKKVEVVYGALPGEVFFNERNKTICEEMGKALFAPAPEKKAHACPLCGGDVFRLLGGDRVKCMLCSNSGVMNVKDGSPVFDVQRAEHELFLTGDEAMRHGEWLREMKGRFIKEKKRLKEISGSYRKGWNWIKP